MMSLKHISILLILALSVFPGLVLGQPVSGTKSWLSSRSGMEGGWVPRILVHPDDPTNLVAAAGPAGIFSSLDGGESWESTGRELIQDRGTRFKALERAPDNPSILYAGTCAGVFRSTDAGRTWALHGQGLPGCSTAIGVDRMSPNTLFTGERALFRSRDGGVTWTQVASDLFDGFLFALQVDPSNSNVVYSGQIFGESLLIRSLDGGDTWEKLSQPAEGNEVLDIALHPSDSATVYLVFEGVVYRSPDRGDSWVLASPDSIDSRIFTIDLHPQNPSRLLAASNTGIFLSTDEGENWQQLSAGPTGVWDLAFDSTAPNQVYAGTSDEGVYRSRDGGVSWESINQGLYNRTIRTLAVNDARTAEVFAGTFDGVYRSQDSGRTWQLASEGLVELGISQLRTIPSGRLIAALDSDGGIFVRADDGEVWTAVPNPGTRITQLEVAATQPPTLYSASNRDGLFRSGDLGVTWNPINEGLSSLQMTSLAVDPADPDRLYAGTTKGLYTTDDGGDNWQSLGLDVYINEFEVGAEGSATLYANNRFIGAFRTRDRGQTWKEMSDVPQTILGLAAHPFVDGTVFAFSSGGSFKSRDYGNTWEMASEGLPGDPIEDIIFSREQPATYLAGTVQGVYRLDPQEYYFSLLQGNSTDFTGLAVTNDLVGPTLVELEARQPLGELQSYPDNPHDERLEAGKQVARLGAEYFGLDLDRELDGWVRLRAGWADLGSFFQFGKLSGPTPTNLDGSVAIREKSKTLYFTRVYDGPGTYPAAEQPLDARTVLALANPNPHTITLTLSYFDGGGTLRLTAERVLAAFACLRARAVEIFDRPSLTQGIIKVEASGDGAVGFSLVEVGDTLIGLNAATRPAGQLFSAQLAHGTAGRRISTHLKVTNTLDAFRRYSSEAIASDGSVLAGPRVSNMSPMDSTEREVQELFDLGSIDNPAVVASLRMTATDGLGGLVADVIFGDPDEATFAAALPLDDRLAIRGAFSQVANLDQGPVAARTFTGLAFFNPGKTEVEIQLTVLTADGREVGSTTIQLGAGRRFSDVLSSLIPASAGQAGGSVLFEASDGVVAQQLFGNLVLDYLSAVPPTIFETP